MLKRGSARGAGLLGQTLIGLGFTAVVVLLLLWLAGAFHTKLESSDERPAAGLPIPPGTAFAPARLVEVPEVETAVGTVRAVRETAVASKLLAKVEEVNVQAGQRVAAGEVLVRLDDDDLAARVEQAEAAVRSAEAEARRATAEAERIARLDEQELATRIERERAFAARDAAAAELDRAREALREARTILAYAEVRSPLDGVVIDKQVEEGDTVRPGDVLLTLYDPDRMQLVARVRETLTQQLAVGQTIGVQIDALNRVCDGQISEIVPEAEAASRTFEVKVTGPCPPGVYSGMFGRLRIPLGTREVLLVPAAAVRSVGQLQFVRVKAADRLHRRLVQLGKPFGDDVEVLSGLRPGELVAVAGDGDPAAMEGGVGR